MKVIFFSMCPSLLVIMSCGASITLWTGGDMTPPSIHTISTATDNSIIITYNEIINHRSIEVDISDNIEIQSIDVQDTSLIIHTIQALKIGKIYTITIIASDMVRNYSISVEKVYGYNPQFPDILINEFICKGSKTRPDKVELFVLSDGNLAGLAIQQGGLHFEKQVILPDLLVKKGEYIIVHFAPVPEQDLEPERTHTQESTHPQAVDGAWDIFTQHDRGLSNTNSSITLINLTSNTIVDAVIYSIKEDDTEDTYKGFGRATIYTWAQEITEQNQWTVQDSALGIMPSDTVNPHYSTTTRSIGRDSHSKDTNSASDWYISDTKQSSFGRANSDQHYKP